MAPNDSKKRSVKEGENIAEGDKKFHDILGLIELRDSPGC